MSACMDSFTTGRTQGNAKMKEVDAYVVGLFSSIRTRIFQSDRVFLFLLVASVLNDFFVE